MWRCRFKVVVYVAEVLVSLFVCLVVREGFLEQQQSEPGAAGAGAVIGKYTCSFESTD